MRRRRAWCWLAVVVLGLGVAGIGARWYQTTRPEYRLRRGQEALQKGDFATAETMARRLETAGHADHAHLLQAALHLEFERPNDAVGKFNQIEGTELRLEAAILYGEWLVTRQLKPAEAERLFRFVLSERPDNLVAHRGLGAIYYDQGAWAWALLHLIRWSELDSRDGRPMRFAGLIYKDMDHFGLAIPCYQEALRRDLKAQVAQEVKEELAECLVKHSLYGEGLQALRECGARADSLAGLIALRGDCLFGLGKGADAESLLDRALKRHPQSPELLRVRGKLWAAGQSHTAAAGAFEQILAQEPQDLASRYQLSLAYEGLGRRDDAAKERATLEQGKEGMLALTKLIQEAGDKPWDAAHHARLAKMCEQLGKPDLARRWLRAAQRSEARGQQPEIKNKTVP